MLLTKIQQNKESDIFYFIKKSEKGQYNDLFVKLEIHDEKEGIKIAVWKIRFFVIKKMSSTIYNDINSDKEGMSNCRYTSTLCWC